MSRRLVHLFVILRPMNPYELQKLLEQLEQIDQLEHTEGGCHEPLEPHPN